MVSARPVTSRCTRSSPMGEEYEDLELELVPEDRSREDRLATLLKAFPVLYTPLPEFPNG